jgi:hypothetical protein
MMTTGSAKRVLHFFCRECCACNSSIQFKELIIIFYPQPLAQPGSARSEADEPASKKNLIHALSPREKSQEKFREKSPGKIPGKNPH